MSGRPADHSSKLARGLLAMRSGGRWKSTQEAAWSLLALDDYRKVAEAMPPDFDAAVFLGQAQIFKARREFPAWSCNGSCSIRCSASAFCVKHFRQRVWKTYHKHSQMKDGNHHADECGFLPAVS